VKHNLKPFQKMKRSSPDPIPGLHHFAVTTYNPKQIIVLPSLPLALYLLLKKWKMARLSFLPPGPSSDVEKDPILMDVGVHT